MHFNGKSWQSLKSIIIFVVNPGDLVKKPSTFARTLQFRENSTSFWEKFCNSRENGISNSRETGIIFRRKSWKSRESNTRLRENREKSCETLQDPQ